MIMLVLLSKLGIGCWRSSILLRSTCNLCFERHTRVNELNEKSQAASKCPVVVLELGIVAVES